MMMRGRYVFFSVRGMFNYRKLVSIVGAWRGVLCHVYHIVFFPVGLSLLRGSRTDVSFMNHIKVLTKNTATFSPP